MAIENKTPMLVEKKDIILVKPSKPIPRDTLSLSTIDNNPTLELLCQTLYVYRHKPSNSNISSEPVALLRQALSEVLVYYYPLAGKLKRNTDDRLLRIKFGDEEDIGVPFVEATAGCPLSCLGYLDGIDVEIAKQFVFDFPESDDGYHPLVLQVTRFSCGGFTVGMGLSHSVCDGFGAAQLFGALAELAGGRTHPSVKPVWERDRLAGKVRDDNDMLLKPPIDPTCSTTSPYLPTDDLSHRSFYVSNESITKLKNGITKNGTQTFTVVEALGAYIWRARFKALKMKLDKKTLLCLSIGIRNRFELPVGYYGNAFVASNTVMTGRELVGGSLESVARVIRESKEAACRGEHIREQLDVLEGLRRVGVRMQGSGGSSMVLTDWRRMGLMERADFGWEGAVNIIPLPWNMLGYVDLCILMPPCKVDPSVKGGVRVLVCLPTPAMPLFKQEMDALSDIRS